MEAEGDDVVDGAVSGHDEEAGFFVPFGEAEEGFAQSTNFTALEGAACSGGVAFGDGGLVGGWQEAGAGEIGAAGAVDDVEAAELDDEF